MLGQGPSSQAPGAWSEAYRLLVESVDDYAIFVVDLDGRVASWNAGAERLTGYRAAEIVGRHVTMLYPREDVAAGKPLRERTLAVESGRIEDEGWRVRKDGSRFWANVVLTSLRDASGQLQGFAKVTRDLTKRRAAEEALLRSEERFHHLVDAVTDYAIFMLDPTGHVATWNVGAMRTKGYEVAEIVGQHFGVFYTEEDRAAGRPEQILDAVRREGRYEDEGLRVRKDGTRFWANVIITALRDDRGELAGFAKITRDLTERRRAEETLRRSEERFRLLVEGVGDYAIYMLDAGGHVTTWNSGAEKIKGYGRHEIVGQHYSIFFTPEQRSAGHPERELETAVRTGRFEEEGLRVRKDGTRFWANVVVTPLRGPGDVLVGFAKVTRDLTDARAAEQTARELLREQTARATAEEAAGLLRAERERYRALSDRFEVILEGVGDGISVQDLSGRVIYANTAAARLSGFPTSEALIRATHEELFARFELYDESGLPYDPRQLPGRKVLAGAPAAVSLIRVLDRQTGKQTWRQIRATAVLGADGRPSLAVNIWHDVTEDRRREEREHHLARATKALSSSLEKAEMLATLASIVVPGLADWCSIHLLEDEVLEPVAVAHVDPAKVALAHEYQSKYPPDPGQPRGVWNVVRTGNPELYEEVSPELVAQGARDAEHLALLRSVGMRSVVIVPIRVRGEVSGTLTLVSAEGGRNYDRHDVALAEELGRRAGTSLDNARLYAAEKKGRAQLELVARAGEALSGTLDYEETLRTVAKVALPALGDLAFLDLVEGDDVRHIAVAHEDPELDARLQATPWTRPARPDKNLSALASGETGVHSRIDDAWMRDVATSPEELELLRGMHLCSMVTVPMRARGELLGALTLCFGKSGRHHTPDDTRLAEELARRGSVAVLQARLYERAQAAALQAEEASRGKDEFLATVSHELRTPLNAILGWAAILRNQGAAAPVGKGIDVIHRNAVAQAKIVDDILDVSRIITGKLRLELSRADLVTIARDGLEVVRPSAEAKGIAITLAPPPDELVVVADPERLQQVVWNLLSNAVKFTDAGGSVSIRLARESSKVVLSVTDTGRGIEPAFLPYVFEPFKQADGSTTRRVGGLGLGLAIVRHIVELHGGEVRAHSAGLGTGSTITIALPVRAVIPAAQGIEERSMSPQGTPFAEASLQGLRVLVVDDEPDARELLRVVLERAGAAVTTAASASEAFYSVKELRPHVLVSDIGMPGEDGYGLMRRIRSLEPAMGGGIPSIALTAYTRAEDKMKALTEGFTTHIGKPVNADELLAAVVNLARLGPRKQG